MCFIFLPILKRWNDFVCSVSFLRGLMFETDNGAWCDTAVDLLQKGIEVKHERV